MENITNNHYRKIYLDILRVLAIFLVLFTHTGLNGNKLYIILDCFRTINKASILVSL